MVCFEDDAVGLPVSFYSEKVSWSQLGSCSVKQKTMTVNFFLKEYQSHKILFLSKFQRTFCPLGKLCKRVVVSFPFSNNHEKVFKCTVGKCGYLLQRRCFASEGLWDLQTERTLHKSDFASPSAIQTPRIACCFVKASLPLPMLIRTLQQFQIPRQRFQFKFDICVCTLCLKHWESPLVRKTIFMTWKIAFLCRNEGMKLSISFVAHYWHRILWQVWFL